MPAGINHLAQSVLTVPVFERIRQRFRASRAALPSGNDHQGGAELGRESARALQHRDQGIALARQKKLKDAERELRLALAFDPSDALTWLELGYVLKDSLRLEDALTTFQQASQHFPLEPRVLNGEALVLRDLGRLHEALDTLQKAQRIDPMHAGSVSNAVLIEIALGQYDTAVNDAERAIRIDPGLLQAHLTLMTAQLLHGDIDQAMQTARAISVWPEEGSQSHLARATALQELGCEREALDELLRGLVGSPSDTRLAGNAAQIALRLEQFKEGWRLHEARLAGPGASAQLTGFLERLTQQHDLNNAKVFVHAEQGIGDSIQFIRYVPQLLARGARVTLGLPAVLTPLYQDRPELGQVAGPGSIADGTRYHIPLLSLPFVLGDEGHHPAPFAPRPAQEKIAAFKQRLGASTRLRIGIAVSGNPAHLNDANRSMPLSCLASLATSENQLVLLQKDLRASDLTSAAQMDVIDLSEHLSDFSDTAALAVCCDVVVSVDSAPAHLAGSLGVPLYLLLPYVADWRWRLAIDHSPWYPSARLFRQDASRSWPFVLTRLEQALGEDRASLLNKRAVAP